MEHPGEKYLLPTAIINSDHPAIIAHAHRVSGLKKNDPIKTAIELYYSVRDPIRYDPYSPFYRAKHYRASEILKRGKGFCISKASLLCALARACNIPSRVGFATVRNHLSTRQLREFMGSDLFVYHGFTEFFLEGKWVKATPAFNLELCRLHGVAPLEFDGRKDSIFHPYTLGKEKFMEYIESHGSHADIPVDLIVDQWRKAYGSERVAGWIQGMEESNGTSSRDFHQEDILEC
jgi:transglutaminase-like putative cysteine protease